MSVENNFWAGKKVFLTGHTGFKGSWLSWWLSLQGAEVTGYALEPPTSPSLFQLTKLEKRITSVIGDLRDYDLLRRSLEAAQPEAVFHLAAQPIVRESYLTPRETYQTNVMGTVNLLEALRTYGKAKAAVMITSDKCYENREWLWGYRESDRLGGYDPYSNSKACAELVTAAYRSSFFNPLDYARHGLGLATARAGNVIGGGDFAVDRLVPDCVRALLKGEAVTVRNPRHTRPWQHVLEPLYGYLLLAEKLFCEAPAFSQAWNFGPEEGEVREVEAVVKLLCDRWGAPEAYRVESAAGGHEAGLLKLDSSKARARLGWKPRWNLETALDKIVEWSRAYQAGEDLSLLCRRQIEEYAGQGAYYPEPDLPR